MFARAKLSFMNQAVFEKEFKSSIDNAFCVVSKMMWLNRINVDGTINMDQATLLKKYELWSYIYYLFYHNHSTLDVFSAMKSEDNGKANAVLFYKTVATVVDNQFIKQSMDNGKFVAFDVNTLIYFVNTVVQKYGEDLTNPVVQYLQRIVNSPETIEKIRKFTLLTGKQPGNVEIVKGELVGDADIKVEIK
jgi:hypothetical protein